MEKLPVQDWNGVSKLKMGNVPNEQEWGGDEVELHAEKEKTTEKAELIVLDMGTDLSKSNF
jgi:hypothetical protein